MNSEQKKLYEQKKRDVAKLTREARRNAANKVPALKKLSAVQTASVKASVKASVNAAWDAYQKRQIQARIYKAVAKCPADFGLAEPRRVWRMGRYSIEYK